MLSHMMNGLNSPHCISIGSANGGAGGRHHPLPPTTPATKLANRFRAQGVAVGCAGESAEGRRREFARGTAAAYEHPEAWQRAEDEQRRS